MERLPKAIFFIFLIESQLVIQISFVILFLLPIDLLRSILHKQSVSFCLNLANVSNENGGPLLFLDNHGQV